MRRYLVYPDMRGNGRPKFPLERRIDGAATMRIDRVPAEARISEGTDRSRVITATVNVVPNVPQGRKQCNTFSKVVRIVIEREAEK